MSVAWAYTVVYNEAELISYWVRHYQTFCERVIVYVDMDSNDGTYELAEREGAEVRPYPGRGLDDKVLVDFANAQYHEATADWVIWVDGDELLYHPHMAERLAALTAMGVSLPRAPYYVMASNGLPVHAGQIYDRAEFRRGHFVAEDAKLAIFDPNRVEVRWGVGKHEGHPGGELVRDEDDATPLKLLHYRWLGSEYVEQRNARNRSRQPAFARDAGFGVHVQPGYVGPYNVGWPGPRPDEATEVI